MASIIGHREVKGAHRGPSQPAPRHGSLRALTLSRCFLVEATAEKGFAEDVRRTVNENARRLKFDTHEFEEE